MGFEGHVFDMISRSRQNREMLRSRRERIRHVREMYAAHYNVLTSKEQIPINLKAIKEEIRWKLQQRRKRALLVTVGILLVLLAVVTYWLLAYRPLDSFTATFLR